MAFYRVHRCPALQQVWGSTNSCVLFLFAGSPFRLSSWQQPSCFRQGLRDALNPCPHFCRTACRSSPRFPPQFRRIESRASSAFSTSLAFLRSHLSMIATIACRKLALVQVRSVSASVAMPADYNPSNIPSRIFL